MVLVNCVWKQEDIIKLSPNSDGAIKGESDL